MNGAPELGAGPNEFAPPIPETGMLTRRTFRLQFLCRSFSWLLLAPLGMMTMLFAPEPDVSRASGTRWPSVFLSPSGCPGKEKPPWTQNDSTR